MRGQKHFKKAGCASCHPESLYTNLKSYDLGIASGQDKGRKFDTPTFVELWRTAPYIYDGRATSIVDVITRHSPEGKRGRASTLTPEQIEELAEFILSQ